MMRLDIIEQVVVYFVDYKSQETAKKMRDTNVSSLLIVDNEGNPLGLVTDY
jgi:CBS domain-containing protein